MIRSGNIRLIRDMFNSMEIESKGLIKGSLEIVYFMRGGCSYTEVMHMSPGERQIATEFINERLKEQLKMPNPIF